MSVPVPMSELSQLYPKAVAMQEAGITYILIPGLEFEAGNTPRKLDALLCPMHHGGYPTRLFLAEPLPGCGQSQNWNPFQILDRGWYSWSWTGVPASLSPPQILAAHLRALR